MPEVDFDHILEYSYMCDKHDREAVSDYLEFHDQLDHREALGLTRTLLRRVG